MSNNKKLFWQQVENKRDGTQVALAKEAIANLQFNSEGLIPVIAVCADNNNVLMMAWMNKDALEQTLNEKTMVYYSRSRQQLWKKGDTSGNYQHLISMAIDCDGDTLLATVKQTGSGACHTLKPHCFYIHLNKDEAIICDK